MYDFDEVIVDRYVGKFEIGQSWEVGEVGDQHQLRAVRLDHRERPSRLQAFPGKSIHDPATGMADVTNTIGPCGSTYGLSEF